MSVTAIGVFLATRDVAALTAWYRALGVPMGEEGHCMVGGNDSPGSGSVFSIMPAEGDLPAPPGDAIEEEPYGRRRVMLNFHVADLAGAIARLRSIGTHVAGPKDYGYGRFAWARDPDGNIVELWQAGERPS